MNIKELATSIVENKICNEEGVSICQGESAECTYDAIVEFVRTGIIAGLEAAKGRSDAYRKAWRTTVLMDNSHIHHTEAAQKIGDMIDQLIGEAKQ